MARLREELLKLKSKDEEFVVPQMDSWQISLIAQSRKKIKDSSESG
jgi:hypothetical protein